MAKAFDTVNLDMLIKALQRIKLPERMIQLINFLFKDSIIDSMTGRSTSIHVSDMNM